MDRDENYNSKGKILNILWMHIFIEIGLTVFFSMMGFTLFFIMGLITGMLLGFLVGDLFLFLLTESINKKNDNKLSPLILNTIEAISKYSSLNLFYSIVCLSFDFVFIAAIYLNVPQWVIAILMIISIIFILLKVIIHFYIVVLTVIKVKKGEMVNTNVLWYIKHK